MPGDVRPRTVGTVLILGSVLGLVSNAVHPVFPPDVTTAAFLQGADSSPAWAVIHLVLAAAVVASTVAFVLLARLLADTPGRSWAAVGATIAVVSGTIFTAQLAAVDGFVVPALADLYADGGGTRVLTTATAWVALDYALLSLSVALFLGVLSIAFGRALLLAGAFAPWLRWMMLGVGITGTATGVLMFLGVADAVTLYAFRVVGLVGTFVGLGLGLELQRPGWVPSRAARVAVR